VAFAEPELAGPIVGVRDSKKGAAGHLTFSRTSWESFTSHIRPGTDVL
jgi:hypothetical protein